MSRVAMFEGIRRRRKGRKSSKRRSKSYGLHTPKAPAGKHWRLRKTRKDAGHKGGKTPAQKLFARAAGSCPYPKTGSAKQRRSKYNDCIRDFIKKYQRGDAYTRGGGKYTVKKKK